MNGKDEIVAWAGEADNGPNTATESPSNIPPRRRELLCPEDTTMETDWTAVAAVSDIPDGSAKEVVVGGQILAIFRNEGELFAIDGMCAHQGGPIAQGEVSGGCVTCPWHGWQYELATGIQTINRQPLQKTYEIREREGQIEVRLD